MSHLMSALVSESNSAKQIELNAQARVILDKAIYNKKQFSPRTGLRINQKQLKKNQ